jgi:nitroreductase
MDLNEALYNRRAVRMYETVAVDERAVRSLIDAAIQAPSAINEQPWSFTVIRDRPLLARISDAAKAYTLAASPVGLLSHHFEEILGNPSFNIFYDAPLLVVIASKIEGPWVTIDCSLAAQNLMLAARAMGLGTCWIGFAQSYLCTPEGKAQINLPPAYLPVAPIIVGYPVSFPPSVPRKPAEIRWIGTSA